VAATETIVGVAKAFRGISRRPSGKWVAYVKKDGVRQCLSGFDHEDEAALAHDRLALHLFGELAVRNFPLPTSSPPTPPRSDARPPNAANRSSRASTSACAG